jgi:hypothetical protein
MAKLENPFSNNLQTTAGLTAEFPLSAFRFPLL